MTEDETEPAQSTAFGRRQRSWKTRPGRGSVYYLGRGLLLLAESLGTLTLKESNKVTVDLPSGHCEEAYRRSRPPPVPLSDT